MFVEIADYPGYLISDCGEVISLKSGTWQQLKPQVKRNGYFEITLCKNNQAKGFRLHRLVMQIFRGPNSSAEVNHIDGNKANNQLQNLEYVTHADNMRHASDYNLMKPVAGEANGQSKLLKSEVVIIKSLQSELSANEVAQIFGVSNVTILNIWNGRSWTHI